MNFIDSLRSPAVVAKERYSSRTRASRPHYRRTRRLFLTSVALAVFSFTALLALLDTDSSVQNELCSLVDVEREFVHVLYRPAQGVHRAQAHRRDAISAFAEGNRAIGEGGNRVSCRGSYATWQEGNNRGI